MNKIDRIFVSSREPATKLKAWQAMPLAWQAMPLAWQAMPLAWQASTVD